MATVIHSGRGICTATTNHIGGEIGMRTNDHLGRGCCRVTTYLSAGPKGLMLSKQTSVLSSSGGAEGERLRGAATGRRRW